jgi:hypothetical protein
MAEHRETKGLPLCVRAQVSLEAEWVDDGNERLDRVEGGARDGCVWINLFSYEYF